MDFRILTNRKMQLQKLSKSTRMSIKKRQSSAKNQKTDFMKKQKEERVHYYY